MIRAAPTAMEMPIDDLALARRLERQCGLSPVSAGYLVNCGRLSEYCDRLVFLSEQWRKAGLPPLGSEQRRAVEGRDMRAKRGYDR